MHARTCRLTPSTRLTVATKAIKRVQSCSPALLAVPFLLGAQLAVAQAPAVVLTPTQASETKLTIYNQNTATVQQSYPLPALAQGQRVVVQNLADTLDIRSLWFNHSGQLLSQSVSRVDEVSADQLLDLAVNQAVSVTLVGQSKAIKGTLQAYDHQHLILNQSSGTRVISRSQVSQLQLPNTLSAPTLPQGTHGQFVSAGTSKASTLGLSYQASGLSWSMDYRLVVAENGQRASLQGFTHINNPTQSQFNQANVTLMAGQMNQVPATQAVRAYKNAPVAMMALDAAPVMESVSATAVDALYQYPLPHPVTLGAQQSVQIPLVSAQNIKVKRDYQLSFYVSPNAEPNPIEAKPSTRLQFSNHKNNQLGIPLPAGNVRVYRQNAKGDVTLVGGQSIGHTANLAQVKLNLGQGFDVNVKRYQHSYKKYQDYANVGQTLEITNAGKQTETLVLHANMHRSFTLKKSNIAPQSSQGNRLTWQLPLAPESTTQLVFDTRINFK
ncbi:MAG: DUF4139 domain-containing protein [Pontibacterium sp.]